MDAECIEFGQQVKAMLSPSLAGAISDAKQSNGVLAVNKPDNTVAILNLVPFVAQPCEPTASQYFNAVTSVDELLSAYKQAKQSRVFESDCFEIYRAVDGYAQQYLDGLFKQAKTFIDDSDAVVIADWLKDLDIYVAVKATESLLNSRADLNVLKIAKQQNWQVHFDHLAIRCGSSSTCAAQRVVEMLVQEHGYVAPQLVAERYYQFTDGWSAYPLYKMLSNGQSIRLFVDQSDAGFSQQIIQHWNRVYGFTAHHLAMRATHNDEGMCQAVTLAHFMAVLNQNGVSILTPTGGYTRGLLEQVFTKPEKNLSVPKGIKETLARIDVHLPNIIENGKLLELVSRRELPQELAEAFFALYGITWDRENALHSAPCFQYFLPAQAAHVIKTSMR